MEEYRQAVSPAGVEGGLAYGRVGQEAIGGGDPGGDRPVCQE